MLEGFPIIVAVDDLEARTGDAGGLRSMPAALREAHRTGCSVLAPPSPSLMSALKEMAPFERPQVRALVPNMVEYLRDASEAGPMGVAINRLRRSNPSAWWGLARQGVVYAPRILGQDFGALLTLFLELELARFRPFRFSHVVLAAPWTDLALAAGNRALFGFYAAYVRRHHRAFPCLETHNGGHLLRALREWNVHVDAVITAVNPKGYRMKPSMVACLTEIQSASIRVLARDITAGGTVPLAEGIAFARSSGASGIVVDLSSPDDIASIGECCAALTQAGVPTASGSGGSATDVAGSALHGH